MYAVVTKRGANWKFILGDYGDLEYRSKKYIYTLIFDPNPSIQGFTMIKENRITSEITQMGVIKALGVGLITFYNDKDQMVGEWYMDL